MPPMDRRRPVRMTLPEAKPRTPSEVSVRVALPDRRPNFAPHADLTAAESGRDKLSATPRLDDDLWWLGWP